MNNLQAISQQNKNNDNLFIKYEKRKKNIRLKDLNLRNIPSLPVLIKNDNNMNGISYIFNSKDFIDNNNLTYNTLSQSVQIDKNFPIMFPKLNDKKRKKFINNKRNYLLTLKYYNFNEEITKYEDETDFIENEYLKNKFSDIKLNKNQVIELKHNKNKLKNFLDLNFDIQQEILNYLDNIPNTYINKIAENIIQKKQNNDVIKPQNKTPIQNELVIHNVYFRFVLDTIIHRIEIYNENNKYLDVRYIVNLLNREINFVHDNIEKNLIKRNIKKQIEEEDEEISFHRPKRHFNKYNLRLKKDDSNFMNEFSSNDEDHINLSDNEYNNIIILIIIIINHIQ